MKKHGYSTSHQSFQSDNRKKGRNQIFFDESRRKGICFRYQQKCKPVHRCLPGSVRDSVRNRFKNGQSALHIVHDFVEALKGEVDIDGHDKELSDDQEDGHDASYHTTQPSDLDLFDEMNAGTANYNTNLLENADKEWFASYLSGANKDPPPADF